MQRKDWMVLCALLVSLAIGCGQSGDADTDKPSDTDADKPANTTTGEAAADTPEKVVVDSATPKEAVKTFLAALCGGDEVRSEAILTKKAREEMVKRNMVAQLPGKASASFVIGDVEYEADQKDVAYVRSTWTDTDQKGQTQNFEITWVLRNELDGWRIAGMATKLAENQIPLVLNFEDPDEVFARMEEAERQWQLLNDAPDEIREARQSENSADATAPR